MARSVTAILISIVFLGANAPPSRAGLIVNGSFEVPSAVPTGGIIEIYPGSEPAGFGWTVDSGTVEIIRQGYVGGAGPFNGPAYDGQQWLDLDGISAGSISQSFATTPGVLYDLSFAYANNPYVNFSGIPQATVSLVDTSSGMGLITPLLISHSASTSDDYDWTLSGAIQFRAIGSSTTLSFSSDDPPSSDSGIFLDGISVSLNSVPEPSGVVLFGLGIAGLFVHGWRQRSGDRASRRGS